ncbi:hypothetical protein Ancab_012080 [Ancistrocladus abbreviatus]
MTSLHPSTTSLNSNPKVDEHRWVVQIRRTLTELLDDDDENNVPICIFNVPKALRATNPDSYTPQVVALGPYHYWRPDLHEMERYKLSSAKKTQKQLQNIKLQSLVDHLTMLEPKIRASYHRYLDLNSETLAWMMAIDSSFLLEFLQIYDTKEIKQLTRVGSRLLHLVDYSRKKSMHNAILRDVVMLENQLPLFVLRKIMEFQFHSSELADDKLLLMLMGFCQDLSPFKMVEDVPRPEVSNCSHLLYFLYRIVVPESEERYETIDIDDEKEEPQEKEKRSEDSRDVKLLSRINRCTTGFIKGLILSRPIKVIVKLPLIVLSNLPGFTILKQPIEYLLSSQNNEGKMLDNENTSSSNKDTLPLVEEIMIPSVVELTKSGIIFLPTNGNIRTINFDAKTSKIYLPTISLDENSEVIFRNLVAYEASNASGPLIFTRYTELMNGIIDTAEDARQLREGGIILNHLKSDDEVANLWNGMSKSLRLTKVPFLDQVIEDVNKDYDSKWKVKIDKFMKVYVFNSWQFLTFLAAVFFLLLMILQVLSSLFNCAHISHHRATR